jgi:hypothetical protein
MSQPSFEWSSESGTPLLTRGPGFDASTPEKAMRLTIEKWEIILEKTKEIADDLDEHVSIIPGGIATCGACRHYTACQLCQIKKIFGEPCEKIPQYAAWLVHPSIEHTQAVVDLAKEILQEFLQSKEKHHGPMPVL